jgi:hypothetical protein
MIQRQALPAAGAKIIDISAVFKIILSAGYCVCVRIVRYSLPVNGVILCTNRL